MPCCLAWRYSKSSHKLLTSFLSLSSKFFTSFLLLITMSSCGNCDCADKSQCVKKGNSYTFDIIETEKSYADSVFMDAPAAEHDGKCKCGTACTCVNCTCGK